MADDKDIQQSMEAMSLLPDRYYIILRPAGNNEFTLSAYDTTNKTYDEEEDFDSAMIIQEGVLDMIRIHTEELYDRGVAAIQFRLVGEEWIEEEGITDPEITKVVEGNVVKVDFGKEIGIKQSSAQITHYYNAENLVGKQVIGVCNFPTKNIAGVVSEVLILGAIEKDGKVVLVHPSQKTDNGLDIA